MVENATMILKVCFWKSKVRFLALAMHRFNCSTTSSKGVLLPLAWVISLPRHSCFHLDEKHSQISEHLVPHAIEFFPDSPTLHAPGWWRSLHTRWNREQDLSGRKRAL